MKQESKYPETARRLREVMREHNMKSAELSSITGIGKPSISHYYNGLHAPTNQRAALMANVFGVDPLWLMGFDVPKYKKEEASITELYQQLSEDGKRELLKRAEELLLLESIRKEN